MLHYTTISRIGEGALPPDLALLEAPVFTNKDDGVGTIDGVVLDDGGHIAALVVRRAANLGGKDVLLPLNAIELGHFGLHAGSPVVRVAWTLEQVRAQPAFVGDRLPLDKGQVPPGPGARRPGALKDTMAGVGLGTVVGLALGAITGNLAATLLMGAFSALCGGLAGVNVGEGKETATDTGDLNRDDKGKKSPGTYSLQTLEQRLRDRTLEGRFIHSTPITAATAARGVS